MTGLLAPILLSLIILHLAFGFTLLQAFSAGAALSTTSLGTTFSVISQAGFGDTRLGAVLTSAAIIDDVVGLILLQVIVSLGKTTGSSSSNENQSSAIGWAIGRPLLASLAMLAVSYFLMKFCVVPIYKWMTVKLRSKAASHWHAYNVSPAHSYYSSIAKLTPS
jgi:Kef-type K+ transport system membrane component KefB